MRQRNTPTEHMANTEDLRNVEMEREDLGPMMFMSSEALLVYEQPKAIFVCSRSSTVEGDTTAVPESTQGGPGVH